MADKKYREILDSVHHGDLVKFKNELSKMSPDFLRLQYCCYSKSQDNVIHMCSKLGRVDFLEFLRDIVAPKDFAFLLNLGNVDAKTPLHEASQFSQFGAVALLLKNGAQVDAIKKADWTPLMLACTKIGPQALSVVKLLMHHGANSSLKNKV